MATPNTMPLLQPYEYRPIKAGSNSIRLLQVLPGTGTTNICCQIFQYTLRIEKAFGLYEALSYVWGDTADPQEIRLKDTEDDSYCSLSVTQNLYTALCRLRDPDLPRTIWIDAICINQHDLEERASQVQIMAQIYAHAISVTIWLGEDADDSSTVLGLTQRIALIDRNTSDWQAAARVILAPAFEATLALLDRPWFRRVCRQVVQEAAVARAVSITCGDAETTGAMFASCIDLTFSLFEEDSKNHRSIPPALMLMRKGSGSFPFSHKLADLRSTSSMPSLNVLPLGELLSLFRGCEATDQRDRIYALLVLSSDNDVSAQLRPDYTKSWSTLFQQVIALELGTSPLVSTHEDTEQAIMFESGSILGSVSIDSPGTMIVRSPKFGIMADRSCHCKASWTFLQHLGNIRDGDILVLFRNAHQPSLLRPCGDHFDIVIISIPSPSVFRVELEPSRSDWEDLNVPWRDFTHGARRSIRKFNLIWDLANSTDSADHERLFERCKNPISNDQERRFNTARVLDDVLDVASMTRLLKNRPVASDGGAIEKHMVLLEQVCLYWEDYICMKRHVMAVQWCIWALHAPIKSDHLLDYLYDGGFRAPDLFEILGWAQDNSAEVARYGHGYNRYGMNFEPWGSQLYPLIFPAYRETIVHDDPIPSTALSFMSGRYPTYRMLTIYDDPIYISGESTGHYGYRDTFVGPDDEPSHHCRYLTRLIMASYPSFIKLSGVTLERFVDHVYFGDIAHFMFVMLSEKSAVSQYERHIARLGIQLLLPSINIPHLSFVFLFRELAYSSIATWELLEDLLPLLERNYDISWLLGFMFLENTAIISHHLENTAIFEHEIHLWLNTNRSFSSVLHHIIHFSMKGMKGPRREASGSVSLHSVTSMFSFEALVRWAQRAFFESVSCNVMLQVMRKKCIDQSIFPPLFELHSDVAPRGWF